jgi:16S rRNA (guanine(1405)-N(7))-methyltransferase
VGYGCGKHRFRVLLASARERLTIIDSFYRSLLDAIKPISRVVDLACGLSPLAIPWMPLTEGCEYHAYDVYEDLVAFLNQVLPFLGVQGTAHVADLTQETVSQPADVALLLKCIPCLERLERSAGVRLLQTVNARYLVVSFPIYSLGGQLRGMVRTYDTQFRKLVADQPWKVQQFVFETELAYLVDTGKG